VQHAIATHRLCTFEGLRGATDARKRCFEGRIGETFEAMYYRLRERIQE